MRSPRRAVDGYMDVIALALDILDTSADAAQRTDDLETLAYLRRIAQKAGRIRETAMERVSDVTEHER